MYNFILGAIAQLGERRPCKAEVCGSIPHSSTNFWSLTEYLKLVSTVEVIVFG
jgi:hypothetical protein